MKRRNIVLITVMVIFLICMTLAGCTSATSSKAKQESRASETTTQSDQESDKAEASDSGSGKTPGNGAAEITLKDTSAEISGSGASCEEGNIVISKGGTYTVSGKLSDGMITVDADDGDVTLVLSGVEITSSKSSAINIYKAGSVTLNIADGTENTLNDAREYDLSGEYSDETAEEPNACIFSKSDLTVTGNGKLTVKGNYKNGIKSKDMLTIENADITIDSADKALTGNDGISISGSDLNITAKDDGIHSNSDIVISSGNITIESGDDAIHGDNSVTIDGGTISAQAHEGIEGTLVTINDGTITINASDDGINGAQKVDGVTPTVEINGGDITINMSQGDTDAIDSNGDIIINGGKTSITGQSGFDYDGKGELNGGEVYVNGEKLSQLTNQFGGGMGGFKGDKPQNMPENGEGGFYREGGRKNFSPGDMTASEAQPGSQI